MEDITECDVEAIPGLGPSIGSDVEITPFPSYVSRGVAVRPLPSPDVVPVYLSEGQKDEESREEDNEGFNVDWEDDWEDDWGEELDEDWDDNWEEDLDELDEDDDEWDDEPMDPDAL